MAYLWHPAAPSTSGQPRVPVFLITNLNNLLASLGLVSEELLPSMWKAQVLLPAPHTEKESARGRGKGDTF